MCTIYFGLCFEVQTNEHRALLHSGNCTLNLLIAHWPWPTDWTIFQKVDQLSNYARENYNFRGRFCFPGTMHQQYQLPLTNTTNEAKTSWCTILKKLNWTFISAIRLISTKLWRKSNKVITLQIFLSRNCLNSNLIDCRINWSRTFIINIIEVHVCCCLGTFKTLFLHLVNKKFSIKRSNFSATLKGRWQELIWRYRQHLKCLLPSTVAQW